MDQEEEQEEQVEEEVVVVVEEEEVGLRTRLLSVKKVPSSASSSALLTWLGLGLG